MLFRRRGLALVLLGAVFAVHFLDRQILAILIPPIKAELGVSDTALGVLAGFAFTVVFSTAGLLIGHLADRADRARVITWSLTAFSAMTALCGLARIPWLERTRGGSRAWSPVANCCWLRCGSAPCSPETRTPHLRYS